MNRRTLFLSLSVLAFGCQDPLPGHGREANAERNRRKIPIIPDDWKLSGNLDTQVDWDHPTAWDPSNETKARRTRKTCMLDRAGTPLSEADTYESGKKHPGCGSVPETPFWQSATIVYRYDRAREGKDPWECSVGCGPEKGDYTLEQIEAILSRWGVSRIDAADPKSRHRPTGIGLCFAGKMESLNVSARPRRA